MEWLTLLLLVPAIVVPVVLLCGFAGCHFRPAPATAIAPNVTADAKSIDHIEVSWMNTDPNPAIHYHFVRLKGGVSEIDEMLDGSVTTFEDTGLNPGLDPDTQYTYQVSTITTYATSAPGEATATTPPLPLTFQPAFEVDTGATPVIQPGFMDSRCFVHIISKAKLLASGNKVRITVRGAPASNVTINSIYISQVGTGNPYNSAGDITQVLPSPLTLPDDQPKVLDPIDYNLDQSKDLIIAFDFTGASGADTLRYVQPQSGQTLYFKIGVQQASSPMRDPGYSQETVPAFYLVVAIEVAVA